MEQGSFDFSGDARKNAGQDRAMSNEASDWKDAVMDALLDLAASKPTFQASDLRAAAANRGIAEPHHPNCWGAVFTRAKKAGHIVQVGHTTNRMPSRQSGTVGLWEAVS